MVFFFSSPSLSRLHFSLVYFCAAKSLLLQASGFQVRKGKKLPFWWWRKRRRGYSFLARNRGRGGHIPRLRILVCVCRIQGGIQEYREIVLGERSCLNSSRNNEHNFLVSLKKELYCTLMSVI